MSPPDEAPKPAGGPERALVSAQPASVERTSAKEIVELFATLGEPWAKVEEAKTIQETRRSEEDTKRAAIQASTQRFNAALVTVIVIAVLALGAYALSGNHEDYSRTVIIALIGFAGGYGFKGVTSKSG